MRILVIGGTRFLGPAFVDAAHANGHEVVLFNRGRSNPTLFPDVEKIQGDRDTDCHRLKGLAFDAVFDTCGYGPRQVRVAAETLRDTVGQYVFISSVSAFDGHRSVGVTEEDATIAIPEQYAGREEELGLADLRQDMSLYGPLKAACEVAAEGAMPGRATNVRPGFIVGPRDGSNRFHYWPWRMHRGGRILAPGPKSGNVQLIDVRDLARFCLLTIEKKLTGVFTATGPSTPLPMVELLYACKAVTSTVGELVWVDEAFLLAQGLESWSLPFWIAPSDAESAGLQSVDVSKAVRNGLEFRPLADTAAAALADLIEKKQHEQWAPFDDRLPLEAKILAAWNEREE